MAPTCVRYAADGWGVGELWVDGPRLLWSELPTAQRSVSAADQGKGSGGPGRFSQLPRRPEPERTHPLVARFQAYFAGREVTFDDVELDLEDETPFGRSLAAELRAVPRGEVVSYGELAALAGRPGAARAAGSFCARNRFAIVVPCHRVVGADGLGSYGSLGLDYKRRLLALEGYEPL